MATRRGPKPTSLAAFCAALAFNVLFLAAMAFGVRVLAPPPEQQAVTLTLLPPLTALPHRAPQPQTAPSIAPALKVLTRPPQAKAAPGVPSAPSAVPATVAPPAPTPTPQGENGVQTTLKETVGCDDPDNLKLTPAQRAVCDARFAAHAKEGHVQFGSKMAEDKFAVFDRAAKCHEANRGGGVPDLDSATDGVTGIKGLGPVQRLRDCGPGER